MDMDVLPSVGHDLDAPHALVLNTHETMAVRRRKLPISTREVLIA